MKFNTRYVSINGAIIHNNKLLTIVRNSKSFVFINLYSLIIKDLFNFYEITNIDIYLNNILFHELWNIYIIRKKYTNLLDLFHYRYIYYKDKYKNNVISYRGFVEDFLHINNKLFNNIEIDYFIIAYFIYKNNIKISLNKNNKNIKNILIFPGGHKLDKEDIYTALKREIKEEINIDIDQHKHNLKDVYYTEFLDNITNKKYKNIYIIIEINDINFKFNIKKTSEAKKIVWLDYDNDIYKSLDIMFNNSITIINKKKLTSNEILKCNIMPIK